MKHRFLIALLILCAAAFILRAITLDTQSLWRDEVDALRFARAPWSEMVNNFTRPGWNGPLYYLLLRGWIAVSGTSEYALRFFSLFFGVLLVPLMFILGARLFRRAVGMLAAFLVTVSPYLVWYSQEAKMYTLVPALAILAIYALLQALRRPDWRWWIVLVLSTSLAFYTHILAALLVLVEVLVALCLWQDLRRRWRGALISLVCLTLPYLPLLVWQWRLVWQARETGFHAYSLRAMLHILVKSWGLGVFVWGQPLGTIFVVALAAWGMMAPVIIPRLTGAAGDDVSRLHWLSLRRRLILLVWVLAPVMVVALISLWQPLFTDRYFVWAAPAFYLMLALGLESWLAFTTWGRVVLGLLLTLLLFLHGGNLWIQGSRLHKSDFRAVAAYIAAYGEDEQETEASTVGPVRSASDLPFQAYLPLVVQGTDAMPLNELFLFQIPYGVVPFSHYYPENEFASAEGIYTNERGEQGAFVVSMDDVDRAMREQTAGYDVVWFIVTEEPMWDERGLVYTWLEANATRIAHASFMRVDVYRYVLPSSASSTPP